MIFSLSLPFLLTNDLGFFFFFLGAGEKSPYYL